MRVDQDIDIGEQHLRSVRLGPKLDLVFKDVERERGGRGPHRYAVGYLEL